jgi:protein involved in polysaccharide export with SLBB domain
MKHHIAILFALLSLAWICPAIAAIKGGNSIEIRIMGVPPEEKGRIDGLYSVSSGGTIRMPLIGPNCSGAEVSVAGMSANAAAAKLEALYKNAGIYTNPTFQINDTAVGGAVRQEMVTISGFVTGPGPKPFTPNMTLYQAVTAAGGPNPFGNMRNVLLMRGKNVRVYDLNNLQDRNVPLLPDDTIEVKEKSWIPFKTR